MNLLQRRYQWLVGVLIGAIVFSGLWAAQIANAQSANPVVTVSENPTTNSTITVTIQYDVSEETELFYYPPAGFTVENPGGGEVTPDADAPPGFNGSQRLKWEVNEPGSRQVTLRTPVDVGTKKHRVVVGTSVVDIEFALSAPLTPTPAPALQVASTPLPPDLKIISIRPDKEKIEPGEVFSLIVVIVNNGSQPVSNAQIAIEDEDNILGEPTVLSIEEDLLPGEEREKIIGLSSIADLTAGSYALSAVVRVEDQAVSSDRATILVQRPLPQIELINQTVTTGTDGLASLQLVFQNAGGALPDGAKLILRFPPNTLVIQRATINGEPSQPELQADGGGYAWANLPAIDGRNGETLTLIAQLQVMDSFSPDATIQSSFIGNSGEPLSNGLPLSAANIALLVGAASQPEPPTPQPEANDSDGDEATNDDKVIEEQDSGTSGSADADEQDGAGNRWLTFGIIGALLLVALVGGLLLFMRLRRRAAPPFAQMDPTPPTSKLPPPPSSGVFSTGIVPPPPAVGQAYLLDSNGRYFPITPIPFTIGRGESNSLIIDESFPQWPSVSRVHAQIIPHPQGYVIEDQGSQNKLRVQGRPTERNLLRNGWKLHIGGVEFTFYDGSTTPPGGAA